MLSGAQALNWIVVSEVTGDFAPDLIGRRTDGTLVVHPGSGPLQGNQTFGEVIGSVTAGTPWTGSVSPS